MGQKRAEKYTYTLYLLGRVTVKSDPRFNKIYFEPTLRTEMANHIHSCNILTTWQRSAQVTDW